MPAVERATQILRFLVDNPHEQPRLSRIAGALGIHKATCSSILSVLVGKGFVVRDEHSKAFSLGPRLISLGAATVEGHEGFREGRLEMFGLVSKLGVGCFIAAPIGENLVVLDSLVGREPPDLSVPAGWRMPLRPPFGSVFYAWARPEVVEEWLRRMEDSSDEQIRRVRRALASVRARGYSIGGRVEMEAQVDAHLERLAAGEHADRLAAAIQLVDLLRQADRDGDGALFPVEDGRQYLIAPIFDRSGRVVLSLTLFGRPSRFSEAEFGRDVDELLAAARRVTAAIGGVTPAPAVDVGELLDEPALSRG